MNKIYFQPAAQIGNSGDLLINIALLTELRKYGQVIFNDKDRPEWFVKACIEPDDIRLTSFSNGGVLETIEDDLKSISKGDSLYYVFPPGHTSRTGFRRAYNHLKYVLKLKSLKKKGCHFIRVGFSIGPFDFVNGLVESFTSRIYSHYGLRENESIALAKTYRFKNVSYFPDLAWIYRPGISVSNDIKQSKILLSFRSNNYGTSHDEAYLSTIKDSLKDLLKDIIGDSYELVIAYQVQSDMEASKSLYAFLSKHFKNISYRDEQLNLSEASELYSQTSFIISNRLHVLLLGMLNNCIGIPFVNLRDNKKIIGIYNSNDLGDLILDYEKENRENALQLKRIVDTQDAVKDKVVAAKDKNIKEIQTKLHQIFVSTVV